MTANLIPLSANQEQWIDTFWNVQILGKLLITEQQYRMYWPFVDGFWSHRKTEKDLHRSSQTNDYCCHLSQQWSLLKVNPILRKITVKNISVLLSYI